MIVPAAYLLDLKLAHADMEAKRSERSSQAVYTALRHSGFAARAVNPATQRIFRAVEDGISLFLFFASESPAAPES